jgi:hypothetical protein
MRCVATLMRQPRLLLRTREQQCGMPRRAPRDAMASASHTRSRSHAACRVRDMMLFASRCCCLLRAAMRTNAAPRRRRFIAHSDYCFVDFFLDYRLIFLRSSPADMISYQHMPLRHIDVDALTVIAAEMTPLFADISTAFRHADAGRFSRLPIAAFA